MPELPEVETIVRGLRDPLAGQKIKDVRTGWPRHIARPDLEAFQERIKGRAFEAINRRGKYLVFSLDGGETLIIHLKMTGQLTVTEGDSPADKHVHTVFELVSGEELRFRDVRKFGRVYLVRDPAVVLGQLGPEPLSPAFSAEVLHEKLQPRRRLLKPLLLDQTFVAGIGNIYADEALYRARLHPKRHAHTLTWAESQALHAAIQTTLEIGIDREGASVDDYRKADGSQGTMQNALSVYGRAGEPCLRGDGVVERIILGSRSTYFCIGCQT